MLIGIILAPTTGQPSVSFDVALDRLGPARPRGLFAQSLVTLTPQGQGTFLAGVPGAPRYQLP